MSIAIQRNNKSSPKSQLSSLQQKSHEEVEYQKLAKRLACLKDENNKLELKKDQLSNTVCDLRKMIKKVEKQSSEELLEISNENRFLEDRKKSLQASLKYCYQVSTTHQQASDFWKQYL